MDIVLRIVVQIVYDGLPALVKRDLPERVNILRWLAWGFLLLAAGLFFATSVVDDVLVRRVKGLCLGSLIAFAALMVAITLSIKAEEGQ